MLTPDKFRLPALIVKPPSPEIVPLKVPPALLKVSVRTPNDTVPAPVKLTIVAPLVVLLISKLPAPDTLLLEAIEPEPFRLNVPAVMVVAPV